MDYKKHVFAPCIFSVVFYAGYKTWQTLKIYFVFYFAIWPACHKTKTK